MNRAYNDSLKAIKESRLVAILRGVPMEQVEGVVDALLRGGVRVLEFTYDQGGDPEKTAQKIRYTAERFGGDVVVGCGTALTVSEVELAQQAGASLVVSPDTNVQVIRRTRELNMVSMPGALTPTEIVTAWNAGADIVKLFPAGELGLGYIKAVRAPLRHIPMSAVGGVKPENVAEFLNAGVCGFGVGGQLVLPDAVKRGDYEALAARAAQFTKAIADWEAAK